MTQELGQLLMIEENWNAPAGLDQRGAYVNHSVVHKDMMELFKVVY